jgi:hypothetical protein
MTEDFNTNLNDNKIIKKSWNSISYNNYNRRIGAFSKLNNIGDFLSRKKYVCGGSNQVNNFKGGIRNDSIISSCDNTNVIPSSSNVKYVSNSSDFIRYKKQKALSNKNGLFINLDNIKSTQNYIKNKINDNNILNTLYYKLFIDNTVESGETGITVDFLQNEDKSPYSGFIQINMMDISGTPTDEIAFFIGKRIPSYSNSWASMNATYIQNMSISLLDDSNNLIGYVDSETVYIDGGLTNVTTVPLLDLYSNANSGIYKGTKMVRLHIDNDGELYGIPYSRKVELYGS